MLSCMIKLSVGVTVVIVSACSVYIDSAVTSLITERRWALQQTQLVLVCNPHPHGSPPATRPGKARRSNPYDSYTGDTTRSPCCCTRQATEPRWVKNRENLRNQVTDRTKRPAYVVPKGKHSAVTC